MQTVNKWARRITALAFVTLLLVTHVWMFDFMLETKHSVEMASVLEPLIFGCAVCIFIGGGLLAAGYFLDHRGSK